MGRRLLCEICQGRKGPNSLLQTVPVQGSQARCQRLQSQMHGSRLHWRWQLRRREQNCACGYDKGDCCGKNVKKSLLQGVQMQGPEIQEVTGSVPFELYVIMIFFSERIKSNRSL